MVRPLPLLALTVSLATLACWALTPHAQADDRPNVLFILADDQAPDTIGAYGNDVCDTPNLDRLAREGMLFRQAHHQGAWVGAVCLPSRTMIMTGRTVWHIPDPRAGRKPRPGRPPYVSPIDPANTVPDQPQFTMPALFNRAGFSTMRTCKRGNSYEAANALFTVRHDQSNYGPGSENGSEWHGERVLDFLKEREASGASDPFLVFFGFTHPHDPRTGPPDLVAKYGADNEGPAAEPDPDAPALPRNWLPAHPFPHGHPELRDEVAVQGVMEKRDPATVRNETGRNYACIENIDDEVGRVLAQLEEMGELDNTYIFYTADHGIAVGAHGLMGKQNLYEHSWRVPYLVRGPGIEPGLRSDALIYLLDTLPTLCELAGIEIPESVEGRSFAPVLLGESDTHREHVYGVYAGGTRPGMRAIKKDNWKLIEYDVLDGAVRETQLFDLEQNPYEFLAEHHDPEVIAVTGHEPKRFQRNLAGDPAHAEKRAEMEELLRTEMERLHDPFPLSPHP